MLLQHSDNLAEVGIKSPPFSPVPSWNTPGKYAALGILFVPLCVATRVLCCVVCHLMTMMWVVLGLAMGLLSGLRGIMYILK